jgi:hypothetical protein
LITTLPKITGNVNMGQTDFDNGLTIEYKHPDRVLNGTLKSLHVGICTFAPCINKSTVWCT